MAPRMIAAIALLPALLLAGGCGSDDDDGSASGTTEAGSSSLPQGSEPVSLDPADFTTEITNPYWPMKPGSRWVYRETDKDAVMQVEVTVTNQTKRIANGVEARVVHDVVTEDGEPVEVTRRLVRPGLGWQRLVPRRGHGGVRERQGCLDGRDPSRPGSTGRRPGSRCPADPERGQAYRQEYYAGEAEDSAKILSLGATARCRSGSFEGVLQTEDLNPLSKPPQVEHKYYARDMGPVLVIAVSGGAGREELISYTQ